METPLKIHQIPPGEIGHRGAGLKRGGMSDGAVLWRAANAWQRAVKFALVPLGLTHVQYMLLRELSQPDCDGGAITQAILARLAGIDPMTPSYVLRTLESKGLIVQRRHPEDSRAHDVALSPQGAEIICEAATLADDAEQTFFNLMSDRTATMAELESLLSSR